MEKTKLQNKAIQDILEDAKDGVLKDASIEKVKELTKKTTKSGKFEYKSEKYNNLREIPVSLQQAQRYLEDGSIKEL